MISRSRPGLIDRLDSAARLASPHAGRENQPDRGELDAIADRGLLLFPLDGADYLRAADCTGVPGAV